MLLQTGLSEIREAYTRAFIRLIDFAPTMAGALLTLLFTLISVFIISRFVKTAMEKTSADRSVRLLVVRLAVIFVWFFGILVTLSVLRIEMATIMATFGVTGAAIGFALHDIIANFVAGIILLSIRPFRLGDTITIEAFEGTVQRVEIRVTTLKLSDGREVSIPNAKVFSAIITNHSPQLSRKAVLALQVGIDSDISRVETLLRQSMEGVSGIVQTPQFIVAGFTAVAIAIEIHFSVDVSANASSVATQARLRALKALREAGIDLYPKC